MSVEKTESGGRSVSLERQAGLLLLLLGHLTRTDVDLLDTAAGDTGDRHLVPSTVERVSSMRDAARFATASR